MKLLLFSDLHASAAAARRLVERARGVDMVIGAVDFGRVRCNVRACVEVLRAIEKPAVLVAGNHESTEGLARACRGWAPAHVLHGTGVSIGGVAFFGIGGGIPPRRFRPWSYGLTEEQAAARLADCPAGCVLISHSPPRGVVDHSSRGRSLGSVAVRDAVIRLRPKLLVCGHIHESAGRRGVLGSSPVVNAGPVGIEWDLERADGRGDEATA